MFHPFEVFVGLRYTLARRRNRFISFISMTSMLGIAIGVIALIVVLSVMNGFERELRERILGMASHATIADYRGGLSDWEPLIARAKQHPEVEGVAPYVQSEAMLTRRTLVRGALIRGIDPKREPDVSAIADYLLVGDIEDLKPGKYRIALGVGLAQALGITTIGTPITVIAPQAIVTPAGILPRLRRFTVVALFEAKYSQFDNSLAVMHLVDAQKIFRLEGQITGLRLRFTDMFRAPQVSRALAREFSGSYWLRDWTQHHANFFRALKTEKTVMFIILTLIIAVAAFNIVSTLIMVVTDKEADIAILRTLGASPRSILMIFIVQGAVIGLVGTVIGVLGGVLLAINVETIVAAIEQLFATKILSPDVYYISDVPSDLLWSDVAYITVLSFLISIVATIYPAWRASRVQPAEALRYE